MIYTDCIELKETDYVLGTRAESFRCFVAVGKVSRRADEPFEQHQWSCIAQKTIILTTRLQICALCA